MSSIDRGGSALARLVERLLADEAFRAAFRDNPAEACRHYGLDEIADELAAESSIKTLELRESKSSLAGAVMSLAAEGFGIAELTGLLGHGAYEPSQAGGPAHYGQLELTAANGEPAGSGHSADAAAHVVQSSGAADAGSGTGGAGGASALTALLSNPRLSMPAQVRSALLHGDADPRLIAVLQDSLAHHTIGLGALQSVTDPVHAESVSIVSVDGQAVGPTNIAARDLLTEISALDPSMRPTEITSPWPIQATGFFTDPTHPGELRLSFVAGSGDPAPEHGAGGSGAAVAQAGASQAAHRASQAAHSASQGAHPESAAAPSPAPPAAGSSAPPSGYVNPLPADAQIGRTDQGVDVDLRPGEPIVAIGKSRVLGIMQGWYDHQPYLALQLLDGPLKGHNYYVAEQIDPAVVPGQVVQAGQVIARYAARGTGIEIGWAGPNWEQTLAQAQGNTGDAYHNDSPAGLSFHKFLASLPRAGSDASAAGSHAPGAGSTAASGAGSTAASAGAGGGQAADAPATPAVKPATAVFAAVEHRKRRAFQRQTVEFRAVSSAPAEPPEDAQAHASHAAGGQAAGGHAAAGDAVGASISVSSPLLTTGQEQFAARLAQLTGLDPRVISAWELAEESGRAAKARQAAGIFDWLNIGYFDSGPGQIAHDPAFKDPISAANQTARFLQGTWGGASSSIRAILATAGQSPEQQIRAIASSDWASSHYGNGANLRAIYDELSSIRITRN